jgi:hypothetical protein
MLRVLMKGQRVTWKLAGHWDWKHAERCAQLLKERISSLSSLVWVEEQGEELPQSSLKSQGKAGPLLLGL